MLRNKIIVKKIRNIFILLMAIIIMLGVYTNIRNSRAENVIQIEVEVADKNNNLETETITVDATETKDGNYLVELPTSVNEFAVSKYYSTDGTEFNMIAEENTDEENSNTDSTNNILTLTDEEIANKKIQLQTDYETKEVTTSDNQTVTLYKKELKGIEPNGEDVIVEGYMLKDTEAEVTELDTNNLKYVVFENTKQSMQKAYEISTYRMVESYTSNSDTEKVEYDPSEYGENLKIKIKNTEPNRVGTVYCLTEDEKVIENTSTDTTEKIEEEVAEGEYATTIAEKKDSTVKVVFATMEATTENEESTNEINTIQSDEDVNDNEQVSTTATTDGNILKSSASESGKSSTFLGAALRPREQIDNVTFEDSAKFGKARSYYDAKQNTFEGHSNSTTTWYDLSHHNNGTIYGGTFTDEYLKLDGVNDYVDLGKMQFIDSVKLDATISVNQIQSGERDIVGNFNEGGVGIWLSNGKPAFSLYSESQNKYVEIFANEQVKVGTKTQIVGYYDGANMYLYVDGEVVAQQALTGEIRQPSDNVSTIIGANPAPEGGADTKTCANINIYNIKINEGYVKTKGVYDATNNTGNGHSASTGVWNDLSGTNHGTKTGGTWGTDYLRLNGTSDWVNLGQMSFGNSGVTLDATISINEIQSGERDIVCNYESGGVGLLLENGVPEFNIYIKGVGYASVSAGTALTVGAKTKITGTYDGFYMDLYINGQHKARKSITGNIGEPTNNTVMAIGANPSASTVTGAFTNMNVYSVRVYDDVVWDFSANNDNSILGWYDVLAGGRGGIRVYIGSNEKIYANPNSSYLFTYIGYNADSLTTEAVTNIKLLDTTKVTNMTGMFQFCGYKSMTKLDLGDNFDTSNVTNMKAMFGEIGREKMASLDLGDKFDTSKVTDMKWMFAGTGQYSMTEFKMRDKFNTSNVTNMYGMFLNFGDKLEELDLGDQFDTSKVTTMIEMFSKCRKDIYENIKTR